MDRSAGVANGVLLVLHHRPPHGDNRRVAERHQHQSPGQF